MHHNDNDKDNTHQDYGSLSYEQACERLKQVVEDLDDGGKTLEEALALWEQGQLLAKRCEELLDNAQQRLKSVSPDARYDEGNS